MYWDLTVFLNFLVDYLLLFAAARLSGIYAAHWRLLVAAWYVPLTVYRMIIG